MALAIDKTLDSSVSDIWQTYWVLAEIAEQEEDKEKAAEYRRLSREARGGLAQHELKQLEPLIGMIVAALNNAEMMQQLDPILEMLAAEKSSANLGDAIHRILDGERDESVLCESLGPEGVFISAILQKLFEKNV